MTNECPFNPEFFKNVGEALQMQDQRGGGDDDEYTTKQKAIGHVLTIVALGGLLGVTAGAILTTIWYFGYSHVIADAYEIYKRGMTGCNPEDWTGQFFRTLTSWASGAPTCGEVQTAYDNIVMKMLDTLTKTATYILGAAGATGLTFRQQYWVVYDYFMKKCFGQCSLESVKNADGRRSRDEDEDEDEDQERQAPRSVRQKTGAKGTKGGAIFQNKMDSKKIKPKRRTTRRTKRSTSKPKKTRKTKHSPKLKRLSER